MAQGIAPDAVFVAEPENAGVKRTTKLIAGSGLTIVLLLAVVLVVIATADWNRLKPTVNERVSDALGRPFVINGELTVEWRRDVDATGWRRLVPWMHVGAADLRLGNPGWAASPEFAVFERVDLRLALLPLLRREVRIPNIDVRQPALALERLADGRANWVFDQDDEPEAMRWKLDIGEVAFDRGRLAVSDAIGRIQLEATIEPLGAAIPFSHIVGKDGAAPTEGASGTPEAVPLEYVFGWQAKGRYRDEAFTGSGRVGGLLAVHDPSRPFPLKADLKIGRTRIAVVGTLTDPRNLAALDLQLRLSGANLADLYPLTGLTLPDSSAYSTDGRLSAELRKAEGAVYHYRDLNGRIGDSDVRGSLSYTDTEPRPLLKGEISSRLLRFADLAPLIGADYDAPSANGPRQPPDRVLPVGPFRTERWRDMDADVRLSGKQLDRGDELPFTDMQTQLLLTDGELRLDPVRVGVAGGSLEGTVHLDGRKKQMRGHARLKARRLGLKKLFPGFEPMQTSLGEANGEVDLRGTGNSIAALLGSAEGEMRLIVNDGTISRGLMEIAGLNVGSYLVTQIFGDDEVRINCAVADFGVEAGLMNPRVFLFDTESARVDIGGTMSLAEERLDLDVRTQSKGMRVFSLRSPLYVRGTFKDPDAGVQAGPLLARGAGMVALGAVVAPIAGLLALVSPSSDRPNPCIPLLEQLRAEKR